MVLLLIHGLLMDSNFSSTIGNGLICKSMSFSTWLDPVGMYVKLK